MCVTFAIFDIAMGRRARTNCSPVDAVLEKYHNDIGNRLSGVFVPPPTTEAGQPLSEDFSMLTLDLRRSQSVKVKGQKGDQTILKNSLLTAGQTPLTAADTPVKAQTMPRSASPAPTEAGSELESSGSAHRDRPRLVDKLTRALFQKKHVCARCNRKSRSCIPNKSLNLTEKRYTCGRCRENSSALKNFFDGGEIQPDTSSSTFLASPLSSSSSSSNNNNKRDHQPRTGNDSGYETVTSCSTVASTSYSAFNGPNSTNNTYRKENLTQCCESRLTNPQEQCQTDRAQDFHPSTHASEQQFQQQRCPCQQQDSSAGERGPVEDRDFRLPGRHDYDGYLPDFIEFRGWTRQMLRPCSQGDAAGTGPCGEEEDDDDTYTGPNIVCVKRPSSLDSSPKPGVKACHTCGTTTAPCFRLPWEGGWLCEDCMDGIY